MDDEQDCIGSVVVTVILLFLHLCLVQPVVAGLVPLKEAAL